MNTSTEYQKIRLTFKPLDSNKLFRSVDAINSGSTHDSPMLRKSRLFEIIACNKGNAVIIANTGYGIASLVMTPYYVCLKGIIAKYKLTIERLFG